jgi:hypothetical protein
VPIVRAPYPDDEEEELTAGAPVAAPEPDPREVFGRELAPAPRPATVEIAGTEIPYETPFDPRTTTATPEPEPVEPFAVRDAYVAAHDVGGEVREGLDARERAKGGFWRRTGNAVKAFGHSLLSGRGLIGAGVDAVAGGMRGETGNGSMGRYGDLVRRRERLAEDTYRRARAAEAADYESKMADAGYKRAQASKLDRDGAGKPNVHFFPDGAVGVWDQGKYAIQRAPDPSTGSPYMGKPDRPNVDLVKGTTGFGVWDESNPDEIRPISAPWAPAESIAAGRRAELEQLPDERELWARARRNVEQRIGRADELVDNPTITKEDELAAIGPALADAIKQGIVTDYTADELREMQQIGATGGDPIAQKGALDAFEQKVRDRQLADFQRDPRYKALVRARMEGGRKKVTRGDTDAYQRAIQQEFDRLYGEMRDSQRRIYGGGASAYERPRTDSSGMLESLKGHPAEAELRKQFQAIDNDPSITDKEAAKHKAASAVLSNLGL